MSRELCLSQSAQGCGHEYSMGQRCRRKALDDRFRHSPPCNAGNDIAPCYETIPSSSAEFRVSSVVSS